MSSIFDAYIDRTQTNAIKHGFKEQQQMPKDVIPLWVADMDFRSPKEVCQVLEADSRFGIFGYAAPKEDYFQAVASWMKKRHGWEVKKEWLVRTPGVVCAISAAVRALTQEGEAVMIMQPVYHPFAKVLEKNNRKIVRNDLSIGEDGRFQIDFEKMESQIQENQVRLFILCSPHNPGGRVWSREELLQISQICLRHQVIVAADEIHHDFVYPGHVHTEYALLNPETEQNCIVCTAPSKTFNIAGLGLSNIFIPNPVLRERFSLELEKSCIEASNLLSMDACRAAYTYGEGWLEELLVYLKGNGDFVDRFLKENLPMIHMMPLDSTYLAWLDFRGLHMEDAKLQKFLIHKAGIWMNEGVMFGNGGSGHMRLNLGSSRQVLEKAMGQLKQAADAL